MSHTDAPTPEPEPEAGAAAPDAATAELGAGMAHLLSALDGMAAMGDRLMMPAPNRAARRAAKRANRKKGK